MSDPEVVSIAPEHDAPAPVSEEKVVEAADPPHVEDASRVEETPAVAVKEKKKKKKKYVKVRYVESDDDDDEAGPSEPKQRAAAKTEDDELSLGAIGAIVLGAAALLFLK